MERLCTVQMVFAGLKKKKERDDLIAYIHQATTA
jgi:cytochrome c2